MVFRASELTKLFPWLETSTLMNLVTYGIIKPYKNKQGRGTSRLYSIENAFQLLAWKQISSLGLPYATLKEIIPKLKQPSSPKEKYTYEKDGINLTIHTSKINKKLKDLIKKYEISEKNRSGKNK